jgi:hypothetical protein
MITLHCQIVGFEIMSNYSNNKFERVFVISILFEVRQHEISFGNLRKKRKCSFSSSSCLNRSCQLQLLPPHPHVGQ